MCANKVPRETGADTAQVATLDAEVDDETALKIRRKKMTWREWVLYDFLRYWYWLAAIALVSFFVLQVTWAYHVKDLPGLSALAVAALAMIVVTAYVYREIWPEGAFTTGWPAGRKLRRAIRRLRWRL
ncbi:MAG: hypothetical protein AB7S97_02430 [Thermoplasmata archaeon]